MNFQPYLSYRIFKLLSDNPRNPGWGYKAWEILKDGMTVDEYLDATKDCNKEKDTRNSKHLNWDFERGWVKLVHPTTGDELTLTTDRHEAERVKEALVVESALPARTRRAVENWWEASPHERYWCEVTDRVDVGADLKAPTVDDVGEEYWGYSLILEVRPGDIVFHYSTNSKAFVGTSVAGHPVEERNIIWRPHGTSGRAASISAEPRPGWWLPLHGFTKTSDPLSLAELNSAAELAWIKSWKDDKEAEGRGKAKIPFQCRRDGLRGGQGYLFKMPQEFVARWPRLEAMLAAVDSTHESLGMTLTGPSDMGEDGSSGFDPKNEGDYEAHVQGGKQRRTRSHEKLVRQAGEALQRAGATVSTPHPVDLLMTRPSCVMFEAKTTHARTPLLAVREAVGQLFEYRRFIGPSDAKLAILLDQEPDSILLHYVENDLEIALIWWDGERIVGPKLAELTTLAD